MKSNNVFNWVLGVAALGATVYVVGRAWKMSQSGEGVKLTSTDADEQATFVDDFDNATGSKSRFAAIKKSGGFGNATGNSRFAAIQKSGGFRRADGEMATFVDEFEDYSSVNAAQVRAGIKKGAKAVGNYMTKKNPWLKRP
jgi:hypothetical protein